MDEKILKVLLRLVDRFSDDLSSDNKRRLADRLYEMYGDSLDEVLASNPEELTSLVEAEGTYIERTIPPTIRELRDVLQPQMRKTVESWATVEGLRQRLGEDQTQAAAEYTREENLNAAPDRTTVDKIAALLEKTNVDDPDGSIARDLAEEYTSDIQEMIEAYPDEEVALFDPPDRWLQVDPPVLALRDAMLEKGKAIAEDQRATAEEIRGRAEPQSAPLAPSPSGPRARTAREADRGPTAEDQERASIQAEIDALKGRSLPPIARIQRLQQQLEQVGEPTELVGYDPEAMRPQSSTPLDFSGPASPENQALLDYIASLENQLTQSSSSGPAGPRRLTAAEQTEADQAEIQAILAEQFGGFAFFLQDNISTLNVGLTADGTIVEATDPAATTVKNVLDVIVDKGIVAPTRVLGILQKTEWWQTTDVKMRQFDATYGELSEPAKAEFLEPISNLLDEEAQFLGFALDPTRATRMAEQIARQGKEQDIDYIRRMMVAESAFDATGTEISAFAAARDEVESLAYKYYVPIDSATAATFAEEVYTGERDAIALEQYFKEQASARFPSLDHAINQMGITPDQYFAPYKYQIEQMLDRTNIDLLEEFPEIIEYIPDGAGGDVPRPMTMSEMRTFVRGGNEWQNSAQGQDRAQSLAFAIGEAFGEVA
jgi:hypothetical protein